MEQIITMASQAWNTFADGGAYAVQKFVFALSGYEMSEVMALIVFLGGVAGILLWLLLLVKKPRKASYLMEAGRRYNHH